MFWVIVGTIAGLDVAWCFWARMKLRAVRRRRLWQGAVTILSLAQIAILISLFSIPDVRGSHGIVPRVVMGIASLWHLLVLPAWAIVVLATAILAAPARLIAWAARRRTPVVASDVPSATPAALTRREFFAAAGVAAAPLLLSGSTAYGMGLIGKFRVRSIELGLVDLPADLDGLTIAHVSDVHIGKFSTAKMLRDLAVATNDMRADLVLLTGDLIDMAVSDLPTAVDWVRTLDARSGLAMCLGNHDLIDDGRRFVLGIRQAQIPLLIDRSMTFKVCGRPVEVYGANWRRSEEGWAQSIAGVRRTRGVFPIVLAHHPHTFDPAAAAGLPLTLSGHTHGGQIMFARDVGIGSIPFKYTSGLYRQGRSALVVSNGAGNWFPMRINAPAEIVKITLRCETSSEA